VLTDVCRVHFAQVPVVGVIYNPLLDEMYTAWRGGGAFLNDKPITVASAKV
jgi:fructose-1,6-bisphosphatase/inositol monophosphatase family enzyme